MISAAIDLGGTRIKLALVQDGRVIRNGMIPAAYNEGLGPRMAEIAGIIRQWMGESPEPVAGAGIAFAGLTNPVERRVISVNGKYFDAARFNFVRWSEKELGLPLVMDNDANAALLGEVHHGCARGFTDAVILILGTGIGTAAMMNGSLVRGKHFQAGCLGGHFTVVQEGRRCTCGCRDCVEAGASTWVLPILAKEQRDFSESALAGEETIDFLTLGAWKERGDPVAIRLMERCLDAWIATLKNLVHAYDPELIILSGGVMRDGEKILEPLKARVLENVWTPWGRLVFRVAENPNQSPLLGMHYLTGCQVKGNA